MSGSEARSRTRGRFVAFEGGEGSGKSTQARLLAERLQAVLTREPGGTDIGVQLREILLDPASKGLEARAEALLMAADRAQHVAEVVAPALHRGEHVVTDRYIGSSLAYQGFGRGLDLDELRHISEWASGGLWPDLVVLLEVSPEAAAARLDRDLDRFETEGNGFHGKVADGYRALAAADPDRWAVIDGSGPVDEVAGQVWQAWSDRCANRPVGGA